MTDTKSKVIDNKTYYCLQDLVNRCPKNSSTCTVCVDKNASKVIYNETHLYEDGIIRNYDWIGLNCDLKCNCGWKGTCEDLLNYRYKTKKK